MVDKEMLLAISDLLDRKLDSKLDSKLDGKLGELEQRLDGKLRELERRFDEKLESVYDRLDKLESDMKYVRVVQLENNIIPRLNTIEACYLDTSRRYLEKVEQTDTMSEDIRVLQSVVLDHSQKLARISV